MQIFIISYTVAVLGFDFTGGRDFANRVGRGLGRKSLKVESSDGYRYKLLYFKILSMF